MSSLDLHSFCLVIASLVVYVSCFNPFEDTQYDISWGGPVTLRKGQVTPDGKDFLSSRESVVIVTKDNEKYQCILPQEELPKQNQYSSLGPDPELLLESLVREGQCSYRQDLYWTYELCHGRHVRQFHAIKLDKQDVTQQEYYLGKAEPKVLDRKLKESVREASPSSISPPPLEGKETKVPTHKLDGHSFPYYKVEMENGTPCDLLGGKPRTTSVIYMCSPVSHNEILSVKEIQTCQYEVEVFTPLLCANDAYRYKEKPIHHITCHSVDGSPDEPRSFSELMEERAMDTFTLEGVQMDPEENSPPMNEEHRSMPAQPDVLLTRSFLSGEYCLVGGGSGWWQYEFCYGNYVMQFHEQSRGPRIDIVLGKWDKEAHINWKKTKQSASTSFSDHYYSGGDVCDLTGKPRHVQVRLKCKQSVHLQEVAISLTEPHTCEYILKVESPIVCPLLEKMDEHGLFATDV